MTSVRCNEVLQECGLSCKTNLVCKLRTARVTLTLCWCAYLVMLSHSKANICGFIRLQGRQADCTQVWLHRVMWKPFFAGDHFLAQHLQRLANNYRRGQVMSAVSGSASTCRCSGLPVSILNIFTPNESLWNSQPVHTNFNKYYKTLTFINPLRKLPDLVYFVPSWLFMSRDPQCLISADLRSWDWS